MIIKEQQEILKELNQRTRKRFAGFYRIELCWKDI